MRLTYSKDFIISKTAVGKMPTAVIFKRIYLYIIRLF